VDDPLPPEVLLLLSSSGAHPEKNKIIISNAYEQLLKLQSFNNKE
jgi:hypothetical protein